MGLGGVISNLLYLGAKLLPAVNSSAVQSPSSSYSSHPVEGHEIEAELEQLMNLLKRIKASLYDAESREIIDRSVKLWLKELKHVAYDAEDALGEYNYEVLRMQVEARDASPTNTRKRMPVQISDGMFNHIKQIKARFDEIEKHRRALRLSDEDGPRCCKSELQIAPTSHLVVESDIFGRENEKEKLLDLLLSEFHDGKVVSVVTIVGTGGLGKTTLAQIAYNDERIRRSFDKFGWICVSEDFNVERLTKELLESIVGISCNFTNISALQEKIIDAIRGERVFLVLDDVWNEKHSLWELFQAPFMSATLMKILVTTRNEPVAQIMQTVPTFNLGYLSEEQCWLLFQHYAFGEVNQNEGSKLVKIGKQIMKKCGRLPLAVKSIASLLRHETEEDSWTEILESELWESDAKDDIFLPLQISYARLPTYLKPCFLYCSLFPKDYCFTVKELVQLWISQGYIETHGKKSKKRIGWEYAEQLWQRSFFEGTHGNSEKKFHLSYFKLHDIIHDLARFKSENEFYSIEEGKVPDFPKELRHLYVDCSVKLVQPLLSSKLTTLRTLILNIYSEGQELRDSITSAIFSKGQKLRSLKLVGFELCEFHSLIDNLKHLRYLSLGKVFHERLPECICSLYILQKLIIKYCSMLKELPKSIGNLVNLEELVIDECPGLMVLPEGIGNLVSLEKLIISSSGLKVLPKSLCQLKALRKLVIKNSGLIMLQNIGNLVSLEVLIIEGCSDLRVELPCSICHLKNLRKFILNGCEELEAFPTDMRILSSLQTVEIGPTHIIVPPKLNTIIGSRVQNVVVDCETIGWLRDFVDLDGTLCLWGLNTMPSLTDLRCANLVSMQNLKSLKLYWISHNCWSENVLQSDIKSHWNAFHYKKSDSSQMIRLQFRKFRGSLFPKWFENCTLCASLETTVSNWNWNENVFSLVINNRQNTFLYDQDEFSRIHSLQHHPNLRELHIAGYSGVIFPDWIGNPTSCASLETIVINNCRNLAFCSFGTLRKLKILIIHLCSSLQFIQVDSLPQSLQELEIFYCRELISVPGIQKLKALVKIHIGFCDKLQSLLLREPSTELTLCTNESLLGLRNLTALRSLQIQSCPKLQLLVDELLPPVESCEIEISNCPGLKDWCLQHRIICT